MELFSNRIGYFDSGFISEESQIGKSTTLDMVVGRNYSSLYQINNRYCAGHCLLFYDLFFSKKRLKSPKDYLPKLSLLKYFNGGTRPMTLVRRLINRGNEAKKIEISGYSCYEKIKRIKSDLDNGYLVFTLIKNNEDGDKKKKSNDHWVVLVGYDDYRKIFFVYNSKKFPSPHHLNIKFGNQQLQYNEFLKKHKGDWKARIVKISEVIVIARPQDNEVLKNNPTRSLESHLPTMM